MRIRFGCRMSNPLLRNDRGSVTTEAALVLPAVLLSTVLVIFAAAYAAQSSLVYVTSRISADRVSHVWDNSYKHPVSGMYSLQSHDPLYWRWAGDGAQVWFGMLTGIDRHTVVYPAAAETGAGSLVQRKLSGGSSGWPYAYTGEGAFRNNGFIKSVTVEARVPFPAPSLFEVGFDDAIGGRSGDIVTEPAEFIRNIDMALSYLPLIRSRLGVDRIGDTISDWIHRTGMAGSNEGDLTFAHHAEAVKYVRSLVRGQERRIATKETGHWRLIDAMDRYGVAHQTYIGPKHTAKDVTDQMLKDAELIRDGKLNGVVWHFFRRTGDADSGPSPSLRSQLESRGIMVVVHS